MNQMYTLQEAIQAKYGKLATRLDKNGFTVLAGRAKSIASAPWLQPWCGHALRDGGTRKLWPMSDIHRWATVFDHNREEYIRELLTDPRREVAEGVQAQLVLLAGRGRLPDYARALLEHIGEEVSA